VLVGSLSGGRGGSGRSLRCCFGKQLGMIWKLVSPRSGHGRRGGRRNQDCVSHWANELGMRGGVCWWRFFPPLCVGKVKRLTALGGGGGGDRCGGPTPITRKWARATRLDQRTVARSRVATRVRREELVLAGPTSMPRKFTPPGTPAPRWTKNSLLPKPTSTPSTAGVSLPKTARQSERRWRLPALEQIRCPIAPAANYRPGALYILLVRTSAIGHALRISAWKTPRRAPTKPLHVRRCSAGG